MRTLAIYFVILAYVGLVKDAFSQGTPCSAVAANVSCSSLTAASIPTGWTSGNGIANPACDPGANTGNYWFTYTPPAGVQGWIINVYDPGNNPAYIGEVGVQVYSASSSNCATATFTLLNCFNDVGNNVNQEIAVTPGTIYYVRVFDIDGNGEGSSFSYCTTPILTGDRPCYAIPITTFPFSYSGSTNTAGLTNYMVGGCSGNYVSTSGAANDMFFSVNVAANSYLTLNLSGITSGDFMELSVFSAASCTGPTFTCLSNGAWTGGLQAQGGSTSSPCRTVYFANAGTYYIRIDGNTGDNGPFTLSVNSYTPTGGDACSNAIGLDAGTPITINNTNCAYTLGTDDPVPSSLFCAGTVENTNWLVFQSDGSGNPISVNVNAVTCQTGYFAGGNPPAFYSASGQFGILTSNTNACGGTYSTAVACQSLTTGSTFSTSLTNSSVRNYYFIWDGNGGAECTYSITVTNVNPLPVELIEFTGKYNGKKVQLQWATNSEVNNDYFTVERSLDSKIFSVVNTVDGKGTTNSLNFYSVFDDNPNFKGVTYYRLKQTDFDGSIKYSDIIAVKSEVESLITIYPNPFNDELVINLDEVSYSDIDFILSDVTGTIMFQQEYKDLKEKQIKVTKTGLHKGVYLYRINADGKVITGKVIRN